MVSTGSTALVPRERAEVLAALTLAVLVMFVVARAIVYAAMPLATETYWVDWQARDVVMTLPRLGVLLASLVLARSFGVRLAFLPRPIVPWAVALIAIFGGLRIMDAAARHHLLIFDEGGIAVGATTTVVVALWEEIAFRGILFPALLVSSGPRRAALVSSLIFMVMHFQAQPPSSWPFTFAFGFVACAAYANGAGLAALILVHWLVNTAFFIFGTVGEPQPVVYAAFIIGELVVFVAAFVALTRLRRRR